MESSSTVARSKEKLCGVCYEVVIEKARGDQRFGILPNCNHCFCLPCIRKWRQSKYFDNNIIKACPECRVSSDFVCPSVYWVETKEEKDKLIMNYKYALSQKNCRYFKQGRGQCLFGNECFYLHALPDGTKIDVGPPPPRPPRQNLELLQGPSGLFFSEPMTGLFGSVAYWTESTQPHECMFCGGSANFVLPSDFPFVFPAELHSNFPTELPAILPADLPDNLPDELPTILPEELPANLPAGLPVNLPAELPTNLPAELPANLLAELPDNLPAKLPDNLPAELPDKLPAELPADLVLPK